MIKPFKHQLASLKHADKHPEVFDCSDPGTGKTFVRILAFAKRRRAGGGCMLVLAPKSLLRTVWAADVAKFAPDMKVSVAVSTNRDKMFAVDADIYVTNHDAVKWLVKKPASFFKKFSELVIDESSAYKHHTSQRSKAVAYIRGSFKYVCCMTGTPNSRSITDIWHQAYLVDQGKRLGPSFYKFRDAVCVPKRVGFSAQALQWDDKEGAEEAVFGLLKDITVRHKFEECVDIPPNFAYSLKYELPLSLRKAYDVMAKEQLLFLKKSQKSVIAVNAAIAATKLLQIASGAVYDEDGNYHTLDTERYEMIMDLVEARDHSLVLYFWKHQRDNLVYEARSRGVSFCVIDGEVPERERADLVKRYQAGEFRVLFGHPKSIGHGLTLTRGKTTIWSSPTYDLEWYKQGSSRQYRIGQTERTETITILAEDTFDERAYEVMTGRHARMKSLLDLFEST